MTVSLSNSARVQAIPTQLLPLVSGLGVNHMVNKQTNKQTNKQQKEQLHVLLQSQRTATLYSGFTFLLFSPGMERGNKLAAGYVQD